MDLSSIDAPQKLRIGPSTLPDAGRGVFATAAIRAGEIIERCPVVALEDKRDRARLRKTGLVNYYFLWGKDRDRAAICLGWGAVYNHSFAPNARFEKAIEDARMDFTALRDIKEGEEILVNYNGDPENTQPLLIPGIPAEAGGMPRYRAPRVVRGVLRRIGLVRRWLAGSGTPASAFLLVAAGAF
jgi:SET domain-containing protein